MSRTAGVATALPPLCVSPRGLRAQRPTALRGSWRRQSELLWGLKLRQSAGDSLEITNTELMNRALQGREEAWSLSFIHFMENPTPVLGKHLEDARGTQSVRALSDSS